MPTEVLHIVTLLHPNDFIAAAGMGGLRSLPYLTKSRTERNAVQKKLAEALELVPKVRYVPGVGTMLDFGKPDPEMKKEMYYIQGACLGPYLNEPRLLYFPDEPNPRFKWKAEFRSSWSDEQAKLADHDATALVGQISRSLLRVKALWLNRPFDPNATEKVRVNLVLGPLKNAEDHVEVKPCFKRLDGRVWIEW
jgi:hypothetical protein